MSEERAIRALTDVVAVERAAPGLLEVVTVSDSYTVDARDAGCHCPDREYNLTDDEPCKHQYAAVLATSDALPTPFIVDDDLSKAPEPLPDFEDFDPEGEYV